MLFIILIQTLLMLPVEGAFDIFHLLPEINFGPMEMESPCTRGIRDGIDRFKFTGTIGQYPDQMMRDLWFMYIIIEISVSPSKWTELCRFHIGPCWLRKSDYCYCDYTDDQGIYHFVINHPARVDFSKGIIRAKWQYVNGTFYYSPPTERLPVIYDVNKALVLLKVNDKYTDPLPAPIELHFQFLQNNSIELCCSHTASPCYARLVYSGLVVTSETNCIRHNVEVHGFTYMASVQLSYSVCDKSEITPAGSGLITTLHEVRRRSSQKQASVNKSESGKDFTFLNVLLGVLTAIVPVAIGVAIVYSIKEMSKNRNRHSVEESGTIDTQAKKEAAVEQEASDAD